MLTQVLLLAVVTLKRPFTRPILKRLRPSVGKLRLRNLGGIIIIDFIDMEDEEHKRQVLADA